MSEHGSHHTNRSTYSQQLTQYSYTTGGKALFPSQSPVHSLPSTSPVPDDQSQHHTKSMLPEQPQLAMISPFPFLLDVPLSPLFLSSKHFFIHFLEELPIFTQQRHAFPKNHLRPSPSPRLPGGSTDRFDGDTLSTVSGPISLHAASQTYTPPKPITEIFKKLANCPWLTSPNGVYDFLDPYPYKQKVNPYSQPSPETDQLDKDGNTQMGGLYGSGVHGFVSDPTKQTPPIQKLLKTCVLKPTRTKNTLYEDIAWWRRAEPYRSRISVTDVMKRSFTAFPDPEAPFRYNTQHSTLLYQLSSNAVEAEWNKTHNLTSNTTTTTISDSLLSAEIEAFYNIMSVTQSETLARFNLIERIWTTGLQVADQLRSEQKHKREEKVLPDALYIYGSFSSHLSLPMGDIDLLFCTKEQVQYIECAQREIRAILEAWYGKSIRERVKLELSEARRNKTHNLRRILQERHHLHSFSTDVQLVTSLQLHFLKQTIPAEGTDSPPKFCAVCGNILFPPFTVCDCDPDVALWYHSQAFRDSQVSFAVSTPQELSSTAHPKGTSHIKQLLQIPLTVSHLRRGQRVSSVSPLQHLLDMSNPLSLDTRMSVQNALVVPSIRRVLHDSSDTLTLIGQTLHTLPAPDRSKTRPKLTPPKVEASLAFLQSLRDNPFTLPEPPKVSLESTHFFLSRMFESLQSSRIVSHSSFISTARVPIVKVSDSTQLEPRSDETLSQSLSADVGFGSVSGIINSDFLRCLLVVYPTAKYLIFVLKMYLLVKKLNEPYTGGIGGYALSLLVLSHLQQYRRNFGKDYKTESLGRLLITFCQLYGESPDLPHPPNQSDAPFSFSRFMISVRADGKYMPIDASIQNNPPTLAKHPKNSAAVSPMIIEDPLDPNNNTSRSCYRDVELKECFLFAYRRLTDPIPPPLHPVAYHMCENVIEDKLGQPRPHQLVLTEAEQIKREMFMADKEILKQPLPSNFEPVVPTILGSIIYTDQTFKENRDQFNRHFHRKSPFFADPRVVLSEQMDLVRMRMDELKLKEPVVTPNPEMPTITNMTGVVKHCLLSLDISKKEDEADRMQIKQLQDERRVQEIAQGMKSRNEEQNRNSKLLSHFLHYVLKSVRVHHPHLSTFFPSLTTPGSPFFVGPESELLSQLKNNKTLTDLFHRAKQVSLAHLFKSYEVMSSQFPLISTLTPFRAVNTQSTQYERSSSYPQDARQHHSQRSSASQQPLTPYQQSPNFMMQQPRRPYHHTPYEQADEERLSDFAQSGLAPSPNLDQYPPPPTGTIYPQMYNQHMLMNYPMGGMPPNQNMMGMPPGPMQMGQAMPAPLVRPDGYPEHADPNWPHQAHMPNRQGAYGRPQHHFPTQPNIVYPPYPYQMGNQPREP